MNRTRALLITCCIASPVAAAALAALLPLGPLWAAGLGAIIGALILLPCLRAIEARTAQAFCERVLDVIPYPISVKNAKSKLLMVNEAMLNYKRMTREALIGTQGHLANEPPEVRNARIEEDRMVLAGLPVWKEEHIEKHPVSGKELFQVIIKGRCKGLDDELLIVAAQFDTTELHLVQREVEDALAREVRMRERISAYIQRLIDVIPQPVYVKGADSRYQLINKALLDDMHKEPGALLGKNPLDLGAKPEYASLVMNEDQRITNGEVVYKEEHIQHPYTGKEVFRIISKRSCLDAEGQPVIVGANFDITPLRQAERAAAQASEAKSLFLATMSHEIRTPLGGVIGMLRIALRRPMDEALREQLGISLRSAEALLTIINDVLDFSKIEAGHLQLEEIDFDLQQTVSDALQGFQHSASERGIALQLDMADGLGRYYRGDPTRLRQILINLTGNALKFTQRGSVTLRLLPAATGFICEVIDTGIGISAEALPRMFQRFQQADSSTTRKFGGTGLGLAICKQLVEAMGGDISVSSVEGAGTTFRFALPLEPGEAPQISNQTALSVQTRKLSLLCAEDSPTNQIIIRSLLNELGHQVVMASTGFEALRMLADGDYDAVLMDGRMPELDGLATTRAIRAGGLNGIHVRAPDIPVIALTANVSDEDVEQFRAAGADHFLAKPIDEQQLAALMAQIGNTGPAKPESSAAAEDKPATKAPLAERLKMMLVKSLPARIKDIDDAMQREDFDTLERLFHSLKGNVSYGGNPALVPQATELESCTLARDMTSLAQQWPPLRDGLQALCDGQAG